MLWKEEKEKTQGNLLPVEALKELPDLVLKGRQRVLLAQAQVLELVPRIRSVHGHVAADALLPGLVVHAPALEYGVDALRALDGLLIGLLEDDGDGLARGVGDVVDVIPVVATQLLLVEPE